jgi:hypothetical protein
MIERKETLYDVLGISRDAKLTDVTRAYNRHKSTVTRDDAPPDLKRETLIREAYETLADDDRRAAYDRSLVAPDRRYRSRMRGIVVGIVGVAIAGGYLAFMRPKPPAAPVARASQDILNDASLSVGELRAIDLTGKSSNAGLVFAIGENVLVGACREVTPTSQVIVNIAARETPARVLAVDEQLGLCRLLARGVGSRPFDAAPADPKAGDLVYAAKMNGAGKVSLAQGTVQRVVFDADRKVIEATTAAPSGGPLLDTQGQVLGVATGNAGKYLPVPRTWIAQAREPFKEEHVAPPPEPTAPPSSPASPGTSAADAKALQHLTPDQRQRLEKAYRPPPDTKDDWMK